MGAWQSSLLVSSELLELDDASTDELIVDELELKTLELLAGVDEPLLLLPDPQAARIKVAVSKIALRSGW